MVNPILSIRNLVIEGENRDGRTTILKGIDLTLARGEIMGLVGESGSGKSTLGLSALGYVRSGCTICEGRIEFDGTSLLDLPKSQLRKLRGHRIAYVAQSAAAYFNPGFRLIDQTIETAVMQGISDRNTAKAAAIALYRALQLPDPEHIGNAYPHQVSGGQLQRIMTAMAMINRPDVIIFDEPTTALDCTTQVEVLGAIRNVGRERQTAALFISHDLPVVAQMADHIAIMRSGEVIEEGSTSAILDAPKQDYTRSLWSVRQIEPPFREAEAPLLSIRGLTAGYVAGNDILDSIDLELPHGQTLAIVGESGSGKSTLARTIVGLLPRCNGTIKFDDHILPRTLKERKRDDLRAIQLIHQSADTSLNPRQRVCELIGHPLTHFRGLRGKALKDRVAEVLKMMELDTALLNRYPGELSGGQKQRVAIARALVAEPRLIICDGITSALDQLVQEEILKVLTRLQQELKLTILFITHDLTTVRAIADQVVIMQNGRIVESGTRAQVLDHPRAAYTRNLVASAPAMTHNWLDNSLKRFADAI
jgi:peptide/nickel transport system ATP-binding protein